MREIRYITLRKRIEIDGQERDRLTVRNRKRGTQRRLVSDRQEHVNFSRRKLTIVFLVAFDVRCLDIVECEIPAFLIAEFGHTLQEIRIIWCLSRLHAGKADTQHLWLLLRARRQRPCRRATEQRDERASPHGAPLLKPRAARYHTVAEERRCASQQKLRADVADGSKPVKLRTSKCCPVFPRLCCKTRLFFTNVAGCEFDRPF